MNEIETLKTSRPSVPPPTHDQQETARHLLLQVIEQEERRLHQGRPERVHRQPRRRAAIVSVATVAVALLVLVGVIGLGPTRPAAAGVQITEGGEFVTVVLTDPLATPEAVGEALRDAGFNVTIHAVPVSPSKVGALVSYGGAPQAPDLELLGVDGVTFTGFRVRTGFDASFDLYFGRSAAAGESYVAGGSAYAPGEPLACVRIWGLRVDDALPIVAERQPELRIRWQVLNEDSTGMVEVEAREIGEMHVTDALSDGPNEVMIYASTTPESLFGSEPPDQSHCTE